MSLYSDLNEVLTPYAQKIKGLAAADEEIKADLGDQVTVLRDYNVYDNLLMHPPIRKQTSGITWTPNADNSVAVSGTASSTSLNNLFFSVDSIPGWVVPGETYRVKYQASVVKFRVLVYEDNDTTNPINIISTTSDAEFTIPLNTTGMIIRYAVSSGETANETVKAEIPSAETNAHLTARLNAMMGNENTTLNVYGWEIGSITSSGDNTSSTTRIRTINGVDVSYLLGMSTVIDDGFKCAFVWYGDNGAFLRDDYWITGTHIIKKPDGALMLRIVISDINDGTADISYSEHVHISGVYYNQTSAKNLALTVGKLVSFDFANYVGSFNRGSINVETTPISIKNTSANIRRTAVIPVTESYQLEMTSADYLFRLYWKDGNDAIHSTGWARSWTLPVNDYVGITIKRADEMAFDVDERAELHFAPFGTPKDYFKNEIESVTSRVKAANTEPSLCFLLSTDQHTMAVQGTLIKYDTISDMVINMRELAKRINFDANISLGDIADYKVGDADHFATYGILDNTDYQALDYVFYQWMDDAMDKLASVHPNLIYVPGNHDDNRYINKDVIKDSTSAYDYSLGEMYSYYVQRSQLRRVPNMDNNGLDYYVDFPDFKIRMFCLDSNHYYDDEHTSPHGHHNCWWYGFQDATVSWMRGQLSQIPSGWSVLLLSHMSPVKANNADNTAYINMEAMQQVIQDFIDGGGSYIATLYGHSHMDWSTTIPWLEIAFNCQKCENRSTIPENMPGGVRPTRTRGTATEDSWNVVMIQPGSRKIKVIRFGAGDDRTFSY